MKFSRISCLTLILASLSSTILSAKKPNIILLMIDDCSAVEFSCYATDNHPSGNQTPYIDQLAADGLQFTTCWAAPLCMPARAMLMTGKYGSNTGVFGNRLSNGGPNFASRHKPMSRVLKDQGYETAISGKWHLPGNAGEEAYGFDEYSLLGGYFRPFDKPIVWEGLWFSWTKASNTFYDKAEIGRNRGNYPALYWNGCVVENGELMPSDSNTYAPDLNQEFALDFIKRPRESPFFLYYPMVLPHDPFFGTPVAGQPGQRTKPGFNNLLSRAEYYVDELIRTLKQEGLYENIVIVFTADNATLANGKGSCSELGVRVPLIVCGGPVKARGVTDVMVDFTDIYPTLLELAGLDVTANDQLDGFSFQALLEGEDYKGKGYVFSFLDLERTVRTREYMMDGSGGIWKCDPSGNLLDYTPMEENATSESIRSDLMKLIAPYKLPEEKDFGKERMERARRDVPWPSLHSTTLAAFRNGDQWMFNERRFGE